MTEVKNTNVFDANKKFVDFEGLDYFWEKAKAHIDDADKALAEDLDKVESDVDGLKTTVGNAESGLVKDVAQLRTEVNALGGAEGGISGMINNAINELDVTDEAVEGQYVSSVSEVDGKIVVTREDLPDFTDAINTAEQNAKNYADGKASANATAINGLADRVASLEGIEKAVDVVYGTDKFIYLVDAEGNKIGDGFDASDFIVDGMLDSVEFETVDGVKTNNLVFTFNTASGKDVVKVDFSKYVDVYHADNTSIALDSTTNTFSVKDVDAAKTTLKSSIQIAGGPLANNIAETNDVWPSDWKDTDGNKIIPQGKSMEQILTALFLKVIDGTVKWGNASWDPTIGKPSITLSSSGPVEVGTTIKVTKLQAGAVDAKKRSITCTCSQGYFNADADGNATGTHQTGNKTVSVTASIDGDASLACTWNTVATDITVNSTELDIAEGTNTFAVSQSGQTAQCDAFSAVKVFAATNTKTLLANVSATITDTTKPADKPLTNSNSATCTGKYKYFLGYSDNTLFSQFNSTSVRALTTKSDWITVDGTTTILDANTAIKSNGKSIVIACPAKYKLTTVNNGVGANILDNFTTKGSEGTVDVATGNITTSYKVYVYPITNGAEVEFKNVTLTKA
jgi:hypothetical protein